MMFAMRGRFLGLLLATVAVVTAAAWLSTRRQASSESASLRWLPGLRADLDRITAIHLTGAGGKKLVSLERDPSGFVVVERDRHPADTVILRALLLQMAEARRLEAKTARVDRHAALGVEAVSGAKATGVRIDLEGASNPVSVTIGRTAAQLGGGTFVRNGADAQAWLVSGDIVVERDAQRWLEKRIADIPATRIERIEVRTQDDEFALVRPAPGPGGATASETVDATGAAAGESQPATESSSDDFVIEGIPAVQMASPFAASAIAGALDELDLLDVSRREHAPAPAHGTTLLRFVLRNGVSVEATTWQSDGKTSVQLDAVATATPAPAASVDSAGAIASDPPVEAAAASSEVGMEPAAPASSRSNARAVATAVAAFNKQWSDWTYVLPPHRTAGMLPARSSLLKVPDEA